MKPRGRCIGLNGPECRYDGMRGDLDEVCDVDSDCARRRGGRCIRELKFTFCLYDQCEADSDCASNARCQCPTEEADPTCVVSGCDTRTDCASGQSCRVDTSITGVYPQRHCTSPSDECETDSDCTMADRNYCGYDARKLRWLCRELTIVD